MRYLSTAILGTAALAALHCSDGTYSIPSSAAGSHNGSGGSTGGDDIGGASGAITTGTPPTGSGTSGNGGASGSSGNGGAAGSGGGTAGSAGDGVGGVGGSSGTGGAAGSGGSVTVDAGGITTPTDASVTDAGAMTDGKKSGPFKILVISTALEHPHLSIAACFDMLNELGKTSDADLARNGAGPGNTWTVDRVGSDPKAANYFSEITAANLKNYDLVYSNNPTGPVFTAAPNGAQKKQIFQDYFDNGGGWAGQHSASDFENSSRWPWFQDNVDGAWFVGHDDPGTPGTVAWESSLINYSILKGLNSPWNANDEWYLMNRNVEAVPGFQVLAKVTVSTSKNKQPRPAVWIRQSPKGGRSFYTIRGHENSAYKEPQFRDLMLRGILWAAHRL